LEGGAPLRLEPFQLAMLAEHFAGAPETVIILPKKNGKTTLLAALALFHLREVADAAVYIGASSRDQATILFSQAQGLVERSNLTGTFDVRAGYRMVRLKANKRAQIKVLASDAKTGDGVIPTLALVDELHRHPNPDLYGVFRDGLDARDGQMVTISTAGARQDSPLGELRDAAHALESFTRDEAAKRNHAVSPDGAFVLHEWCLTDADDVEDMGIVKLANPASWQTETKLRRRHDSPSMKPAQWLRFACGIWTEAEDPWIEPGAWDALAEPGADLEPDDVVWLDIRLAYRRAAIVMVAHRGEKVLVKAHVMPAASLEAVEEAIRDFCATYEVRTITHGGRGFARSAEILEAEGLPVMEFPASVERMSAASSTLLRLIEAGTLVHDGDSALRSQVLAGVVKRDERGWRLQEDPMSRRPIEALVGVAVAAHVAGELDKPTPPPAFVLLDDE